MHWIVLIIISILAGLFIHSLVGLLIFIAGVYLFRWLA